MPRHHSGRRVDSMSERRQTEIINAGRLRIKECDRLQATASELKKLGADIEELPEGLLIHGVKSLKGKRRSGATKTIASP